MNRKLLIAGVDEAGRGPLAGPVVAAAVVLKPGRYRWLKDSKTLSPGARRQAAQRLTGGVAVCWALAWADAGEIDALNVLNATLLAMQRALLRLPLTPRHIRIDGNRCPSLSGELINCSAETVVRGDSTHAEISAASILAKVWRDAHMRELDSRFPQYGFAKHKGYPTGAHISALAEHGPCPAHRYSFGPVTNTRGASNNDIGREPGTGSEHEPEAVAET